MVTLFGMKKKIEFTFIAAVLIVFTKVVTSICPPDKDMEQWCQAKSGSKEIVYWLDSNMSKTKDCWQADFKNTDCTEMPQFLFSPRQQMFKQLKCTLTTCYIHAHIKIRFWWSVRCWSKNLFYQTEKSSRARGGVSYPCTSLRFKLFEIQAII